MVNPNNNFNDNELCQADKPVKDMNRYTHVILNATLEYLPHKAAQFVSIYT